MSSNAVLGGASSVLRVVAIDELSPRGPSYDARRLLRRPVRAIRGGDEPLAVAFDARGGRLRIRVLAAERTSERDLETALDAARGIAGVDDDPTEFLAMVREHPLLGELSRRSDPRLFRTPTVFEALAQAIVEQLVTATEARASIARLARVAGEPVPGTSLRAPPTPSAVRRVPMWKMHAIGIGSRRAATLRSAAMRGEAIERLRGGTAEEAIAKLRALRGVGPWTANAVARDAFAYADAVPVGDLHLPRILSRALTGEEGGDEEMLAALEPFRPHRARVVLVLGASPAERGWRRPRVDPHRREPWRF